jgi:hypothetical protein
MPTALEAGLYTAKGFQLSCQRQEVRAAGLAMLSTCARAASSPGVIVCWWNSCGTAVHTAATSHLSKADAPSKIEIRRQHHHVANGHAAWPRQHENDHFGHFAGLQQASRFPGFFQLFGRPVREQCGDDGAG